jgi:hypothetical protein
MSCCIYGVVGLQGWGGIWIVELVHAGRVMG